MTTNCTNAEGIASISENEVAITRIFKYVDISENNQVHRSREAKFVKFA